MKAIVYTKYGPPEVLQLKEIPKPDPRGNEVLVKVHATTVTIGDCRMRSFTVPQGQWLLARLYLGVFRPRRPILGMELAGEIEAVGKNVTRFKPGDAVFASTFEANFGGYAEYKCFPENGLLAIKPATLSFGEAAASVGGMTTALRCLRRANLQPGLNVHRHAHAQRDTPALQEFLGLKELLEGGNFRTVIDRVYPLEQIVEAHRYVDQGHKKGNVVITVDTSDVPPLHSGMRLNLNALRTRR